MSDKIKMDRSHYVTFFMEYVVELETPSVDPNPDSDLETNVELIRAKYSRLRRMERELSREALRLGLSQAEVKRIAISCGLGDLAVCIAVEFTKKSLALHRMAW